jgi:metal-dependent amidase/aminoacylase/carboxypeptidase family protein
MPIIENFIPTIQTLTHQYFDDLVSIRRDLHCYPELSGQEVRTAQVLAGKLIELGLKVHTDNNSHGLWADLIIDSSQPSVALRLDMDALPITEVNRVSYRSRIPGVMHACGHDVHAAIGIGVAAVLSQMRAVLPGNIRLIFQPEEEEITGAVRMIRAGVLQNPTPAAIFGLHVAPLPAGQIGWTDDLFLAGFNHYLVTLTPPPGHFRTTAYLDAVARRCCQVIMRLNQWHLPETWEEMEAFWKLMQTGHKPLKHFIVYDAATNAEDPADWHGQFGLGIKAANTHLRKAGIARVRAALNPICRRTQTHYRVEPMGAMIDMRNHPQLVRSNLLALEKAVGAEDLRQIKAAFPFNCEDFAYYTKRIPGAMYWLGAANPDEVKFALLHTPDFDVDERCLASGTIAMATLLLNTLSQIPFKSQL